MRNITSSIADWTAEPVIYDREKCNLCFFFWLSVLLMVEDDCMSKLFYQGAKVKEITRVDRNSIVHKRI